MGLERITREERDRRGGESLWGFCAGRPLLAAAAEVEWVQEAETPQRRATPHAPPRFDRIYAGRVGRRSRPP